MARDAQLQALVVVGLVLGWGGILIYAVDVELDWLDLAVVGRIGLVLGFACVIAAVVLALVDRPGGDDGFA
jgi:hypothetical protein